MIISEPSEQNSTISYTKTTPYLAKIHSKRRLTGPHSTKQTYHLELDIKGSGIQYRPGDSIGVLPQNDPRLVQHLLEALNATGDEIIKESRSSQEMTVRHFLSYKANLARLTSSFLKLVFEHEKVHENRNKLDQLLQKENKEKLMQYLSAHDPLDVLKEFRDTQLPLQEICAQFGPLLPRFYSISSSQEAHPDEIHLTVALFTFSHSGEQRFGVASHFLCQMAEEKETHIPIYVQPSHSFFLPEDIHAPIIMVGPGTGVAPFRAFLQERTAKESTGKSWLFFGERNRASDYFYGEYFEQLANENRLRLDLAFSRDQEEKVYVQHRMLEQSKDLWSWLQEGAYFFICGDAQRMAKDVEHTLHLIAQKEGCLSEEQAKAYFKSLRAEKRYRADVY